MLSDDKTVSCGGDNFFRDDLRLIDLQDALDLGKEAGQQPEISPLIRIRVAITSGASTASQGEQPGLFRISARLTWFRRRLHRECRRLPGELGEEPPP
jgi:hypothetical protein